MLLRYRLSISTNEKAPLLISGCLKVGKRQTLAMIVMAGCSFFVQPEFACAEAASNDPDIAGALGYRRHFRHLCRVQQNNHNFEDSEKTAVHQETTSAEAQLPSIIVTTRSG